jgi:GxxExxY protein
MATIPSSRKLTANEVSHAVVTVAMMVHTQLGPGLLKSTHQACLQHEIAKAGLRSEAQVGLPVYYDPVKLDLGYRIDLLVEDLVIVELRSIDTIAPIHAAQVLCYRKLSGKSIGLLINFNVVHLKDGIKRFVSGTNWK